MADYTKDVCETQLLGAQCPFCGRRSWVNNGDTSDITVPDIEAIRCAWCSQTFFIDEDYFLMSDPDDEPWTKDGKKSIEELFQKDRKSP